MPGFDPYAFPTLSPEEMQETLFPFQDQQALLEQQLAQAQALRSNYAQGHTTGLGAGLGGLADVLNGYASGREQKRVGGEQKALLERKQKSAVGFHTAAQLQAQAMAEALRRMGQPQQQVASQGDGLSFGLAPLTLGGV
jgi:hypothetical protein